MDSEVSDNDVPMPKKAKPMAEPKSAKVSLLASYLRDSTVHGEVGQKLCAQNIELVKESTLYHQAHPGPILGWHVVSYFVVESFFTKEV